MSYDDGPPSDRARPPRTKRRVYRAISDVTGFAYGAESCTGATNLQRDPNTGGESSPPPPGTTFVTGPGQTLTHMHVTLIFWGNWWSNNPLAGQVTTALTNLLSGPYTTYLAQYGVGRANVRGTTFATDSEPGGSFSYQAVGKFIRKLLDDDRLPEPDDHWPNVYAVIMPLNSAFQGDSSLETVPLPPGVVSQVNGSNSSIVWNDYDLGDVDNDPAHFLWTGNDGTLDYITTVLSHELVEIASDPNGGDGIRLAGCTGQSCQIADVCQSWCDFVRGVRAQAYWSQLDGECVLPKLYSVRRTLNGKSIGGRIPRPNPSMNAWIASQY
jgi:hypothetical protein